MKKEECVDYIRNLLKKDEIIQSEIDIANECLDLLEECVKNDKRFIIAKSQLGVSPSIIDIAFKKGILEGIKTFTDKNVKSMGMIEGRYYFETDEGTRYLFEDLGKGWKLK